MSEKTFEQWKETTAVPYPWLTLEEAAWHARDPELAAANEAREKVEAACAVLREHLKKGHEMINSAICHVTHGGPTILEAGAWLDIVDRECLSSEANPGSSILTRLAAAEVMKAELEARYHSLSPTGALAAHDARMRMEALTDANRAVGEIMYEPPAQYSEEHKETWLQAGGFVKGRALAVTYELRRLADLERQAGMANQTTP